MKSVVKEIFNTSVYLLVVAIACFLLVQYVGQRTEVIGSSMENTLNDGDNLLVDKISYRFTDPKRFDIIVFPYPHDKEVFYIKRIIGMPGEKIRIDEDGVIYVGGKVLEEGYGREVIQDPGLAGEEILLGANEYFVLGDNRNNSSDSRDPHVGNIKRSDIMGKAFIRIWPLSKIEILDHQ